MFCTGSGKAIRFSDIPEAILSYYNSKKEVVEQCDIVIGTDSQSYSETYFAKVIAVVAHGKGGIFFYEKYKAPLIKDVRQKLHMETNESLLIANDLISAFESDPKYEELYLNCPVSIHVDAGNSEKGKTKLLIPELVGWINACGYHAEVKPDSFVASSIADKISK